MRYLPLSLLLLLTSCELVGQREQNQQAQNLAGTAWRLASLRDGDGTAWRIPEDEVYILRFDPDGRFGGQLDCNEFGGTHQAEGHRLSLRVRGMTYAHCGESLDNEVAAAVGRVQTHRIDSGQLVLTFRRRGRLVLRPVTP